MIAEGSYFGLGRSADARPGSESGYVHRSQCGEGGQTANLAGSDLAYTGIGNPSSFARSAADYNFRQAASPDRRIALFSLESCTVRLLERITGRMGGHGTSNSNDILAAGSSGGRRFHGWLGDRAQRAEGHWLYCRVGGGGWRPSGR